jgi:hypothetical protein
VLTAELPLMSVAKGFPFSHNSEDEIQAAK